MSIIRTKRKKHNFSIIDNSGLRDKTLSWKATGMLAFLMTKPDDWQISVANLAGSKEDGRDSTICALDQLQKAGYVHHKRYRDEAGRFQSEYLVFETQEDLLEWQAENSMNIDHNRFSDVVEPQRVFRDGETATEKPHLLINREVITDLTNYPPNPPREKKGGGELQSENEKELSDLSCLNQTQPDLSLDAQSSDIDPTSEQTNSLLTKKYIHSAQKCDDRFNQKVSPWRNSTNRNDFKKDFVDYLQRKVLPTTSHYKTKGVVELGDVLSWITSREYDDKGLALLEARWGDYLRSASIKVALPLAEDENLLSKPFNQLTHSDHQTLIKQMLSLGEEVFNGITFGADYLRSMKVYKKPLFEELISHVSTGT